MKIERDVWRALSGLATSFRLGCVGYRLDIMHDYVNATPILRAYQGRIG